MGVVSNVILSMSLSVGYAKNERIYTEADARHNLGKALYKELDMDKKMKVIEEKYLSDEFREYGPHIYNMVKISQDKYITYQWSF